MCVIERVCEVVRVLGNEVAQGATRQCLRMLAARPETTGMRPKTSDGASSMAKLGCSRVATLNSNRSSQSLRVGGSTSAELMTS